MSIGEFTMSEVSVAEQRKAQLGKPPPRRIYAPKVDQTAAPEPR
jgi:hypothetical protein